MKLPPQLQQLAKAFSEVITKILRFRLVIGLVAVVALAMFISFRVNHYADTQSDQARIDEQLAKIKRVRFNSDAIDKIKSLKDHSTDIEADLPSNRDNPF